VFGITFIVLAFWSKKKPYYAILTALIIFLVMEGCGAHRPRITLARMVAEDRGDHTPAAGSSQCKESQDMMAAIGKKK